MTERDEFAKAAMQAWVSQLDPHHDLDDGAAEDMEQIARRAYAMADLMLHTRRRVEKAVEGESD